jgi:hypothetical protein
MKCYFDQTQDAIGVCKSCGKGLSMEYAVEVGKGLACKNKCEEDVKILNALIERNIQSQTVTNKIIRTGKFQSIGSAIFLMGSGAVFTIFGFRVHSNIFLMILGAIFIIYGIYTLINRFNNIKTNDK